MISALIFYSTINPSKIERDESQFMEYCNKTYPELLNDYIHIMDKHQNDIHQINGRIRTDLHLMTECHENYQNCALLLRHYRDRTKEMSSLKSEYIETNKDFPKEERNDLVFYIDLLDAMHCIWFHSEHLGLRIRTEPEQAVEEMESDGMVRINKQFALRQKIINDVNNTNFHQIKQKSFSIETEPQQQGILMFTSFVVYSKFG